MLSKFLDTDRLRSVGAHLAAGSPSFEASLFFRLVVRRHERVSMAITSNKSFLDWGEVFSDPVLATAIPDRLLHYLTTLNIKGESYRLKEERRAGLQGGAGGPTTSEKEVEAQP